MRSFETKYTGANTKKSKYIKMFDIWQEWFLNTMVVHEKIMK